MSFRRYVNSSNFLLSNMSMLLEFESGFDDLSPHPYTGFMSGINISFVPAKIGNGLEITASAGGYRNASNAQLQNKFNFSSPSGDLPFSFSFWIYKKGQNGTGINVFNAFAGATTIEAEWFISTNSTNKILFRKVTDGNSNIYREITTVPAVTLNEWMHIAYVDDGIGNEKFYINGILVPTTVTDNGFVKIGNQAYGYGVGTFARSYYGNTAFKGILDQLATFKNHALKPEEIAWIFNSGNGRKLR